MNARINGLPVKEVIKDAKWLEEEFTQKVQKVKMGKHDLLCKLLWFLVSIAKSLKNDLQRGGVLIQKWGRSSAASTAVSIVDAMRSLVTPTPEGDWFSSGVSRFPLKLIVGLFQGN